MSQKCYLTRSINLGSTSVDLDNLVESRKDTSSSDGSEDVSSSSVHEGHETFRLNELSSAVEGSGVLDSFTGGHHHSSSDGIDGVGEETSDDSDGVAEGEGKGEGSVIGEHGSHGVIKSEVEASVHEDSDTGDDEASVETGDTVGGDGLLVDIDHTGVLSGTALLGGLQVVGKTGSGVVQGVDEEEGQGSSDTAGHDVLEEDGGLGVGLGGLEGLLDLVLEGEVQGLGGEVSDAVGEVTLPEGTYSFALHGSLSTVHDTLVRSVEGSLSEHFSLVLDKELDSFNRGGDGLGTDGGDTGEHEILNER